MKLLICTQTVDTESPTLGFFHRWIEEFAKHCEQVVVICLKEGTHNLPSNVKVLSLGKEKGVSRIAYIARFYRYVWIERKNYDAVFVHMNQEYVLLGGALWRILSKKVTLWRNHYAGSVLTRIAGWLAHTVFYTSTSSYTARFGNAMQMPVGVDIEALGVHSGIPRVKDSILFLGRITPSKHPELFLDALALLKEKGVHLTASLYGPAEDERYVAVLKEKARALGISDAVAFKGPVAHTHAGAVFAAHEVYVNLAAPGMFDKTIFEALASGCSVVCANTEAPCVHATLDAPAIAQGIIEARVQDRGTRAQGAQQHTLAITIDTLVRCLGSKSRQ